jgi:hypothetical protein
MISKSKSHFMSFSKVVELRSNWVRGQVFIFETAVAVSKKRKIYRHLFCPVLAKIVWSFPRSGLAFNENFLSRASSNE